MEKLYTIDKNGGVRSWSIIVDGDEYYTIHGALNGKQTYTKPTKCKGKNIGRSNETSPEEQAHSEALSMWTKRFEKDHDVDISAARTKCVKLFSPMRAYTWGERGDKVVKERLMLSPKLDGIRCSTRYEDGIVVSKSRNNKAFFSVPHINDHCRDVLDALEAKGYKDVVIDGELYNHDLKDDFNQITSIVKRRICSDDDIIKSKEIIKFVIFDAYFPHQTDMDAINRISIVSDVLKELNASNSESVTQSYKSLEIIEWCEPEDVNDVKGSIDSMLHTWISRGYEGMMIRVGSSMYEQCKSMKLLKYKVFTDNEFTIKDIEEGAGNRSGMVGRFVLEDTEGVLEAKSDGSRRTFLSSPTGSHDWFREVWNNREEYIGKLVTCKYQEVTPLSGDSGGVPRFSNVIAVRDYE